MDSLIPSPNHAILVEKYRKLAQKYNIKVRDDYFEIMAFMYENQSQEKIANYLGCSQSNVCKKVAKIKKKFAEKVIKDSKRGVISRGQI